jgi:hypothetical protein
MDELYVSDAKGASNVKVSGILATGGDVRDDFAWAPKGPWIAYAADQDVNNLVELYASMADASANVKVSGPFIPNATLDTFKWASKNLTLVYLADQEVVGELGVYAGFVNGSPSERISGPNAGGLGAGVFEVK